MIMSSMSQNDHVLHVQRNGLPEARPLPRDGRTSGTPGREAGGQDRNKGRGPQQLFSKYQFKGTVSPDFKGLILT